MTRMVFDVNISQGSIKCLETRTKVLKIEFMKISWNKDISQKNLDYFLK